MVNVLTETEMIQNGVKVKLGNKFQSQVARQTKMKSKRRRSWDSC